MAAEPPGQTARVGCGVLFARTSVGRGAAGETRVKGRAAPGFNTELCTLSLILPKVCQNLETSPGLQGSHDEKQEQQSESSNQKENSVYSQIKLLYKINPMYLMTHNCFYATYVGF